MTYNVFGGTLNPTLLLLLLCWVECLAPSVCLSVCPEHNSKSKDPKVFKLGIGNDLGYPTNGMVLGLKMSISHNKVLTRHT